MKYHNVKSNIEGVTFIKSMKMLDKVCKKLGIQQV